MNDLLVQTLNLIEKVRGFEEIAKKIFRMQIEYRPDLPDRARLTWRHTILLGPEPFLGDPQTVLVSLAGTLVHEERHTRQNPLMKSWSFWVGVVTRTHTMRLFEWPAYQQQLIFLQELGQVWPELSELAHAEADAVLQAFITAYGEPPLSAENAP